MIHTPCRECGSERIATNVAVAPGSPGLLGRLRARVCGDCGRTDLRVEDPLDLFLEHKRSQEGSGTRAAPGGDRPVSGGPPAANIQCPSCGSMLTAAAAGCDVCGWRSA
jgi:hypothetical protein